MMSSVGIRGPHHSEEVLKCRLYLGVPYREEPSILAWETGNELYYPTLDWTLHIGKIWVLHSFFYKVFLH